MTAVSCSRKGEPRKKSGKEEEEKRSVGLSIANVYGFQQLLSEPKGITNWSVIVLLSVKQAYCQLTNGPHFLVFTG